ncbi:Succinyl-CoA ligase subunit alpha [Mycena indigotica]|uniref:Succinyl-CoA ligase subunit alpha n=1 Tax=Mycena indigotica TaxID=2126181 RepID=A0A8H6SZQ1_9AGAR|nr:Succinyl-CoA ligase subunit alpha [Mycena indigotica]KAF7309275.1 Succinyl-CoA ligase subunit alpha [Mycena indigotica]
MYRYRPAHRQLSRASHSSAYDATLGNLLVGQHTRVIFQGFTGRLASVNAAESRAWGTNVVGGVSPRVGFHQHPELAHLPVFATVREAVEKLKPDATGVYVAAGQAASAIEEALEAEVPLIVAVAEHIPLHDILKIHAMLRSQSVSRLVGANSPGLISPAGTCRIGFQPLPCFTSGTVGVVARSGTLSYEAAAGLTAAGLGQSTCVGVGGDVLPGTDIVDGLKLLSEDPQTEAIVLIGEVGGEQEMRAAHWAEGYRKAKGAEAKPIAGLVAGRTVHPGPDRVMGHAGAWPALGEPTADEKFHALERAGVTMVDHPVKFGRVMKGLLSGKRGYHTGARRALHVQAGPLVDGLPGLATTDVEATHELELTVDRTAGSPCFILARISPVSQITRFPFAYHAAAPPTKDIAGIADYLGMPQRDVTLARLLHTLHDLFIQHEGVSLRVSLAIDNGSLAVKDPRFVFDDAAFRSAGRHAALHSSTVSNPDGMVYLPLGPPKSPECAIGTVVNGAGLALNTVDVLSSVGAPIQAANFLDTGGKATAETIGHAFGLLRADNRVKVVLVNVFGGLTQGAVIARGVVAAVRELRAAEGDSAEAMPVVVRIRGTGEEEGAQLLREAELKGVWVEPDFDNAVERCVELAREQM